MIADFHFLRPWWLLGVLFAVGFVLLVARQNDIRARWREMIAPHLLDHLLVDRTRNSRFRPYHLAAFLLLLGSLAAAGPTWQQEHPPFVKDDASLVIAVDLSPTMDAIDISPSRLERAKLKIHDIVALRPGARTALVAYAGSAHLVLPLTEDASLLDTYADALATRIMPVEGRNTAKAVALADNLLAQEEGTGTILLLTDGLDEAAFGALSRPGARNNIVVLGIGTPEGGPVKTPDGGFLTDASGAHVFAKLDVAAFERLKSDAGVDVATISTDGRDVAWIAERINTHFQQQRAEGNSRWLDVGWWLLLPMIPLGALSFRRGWVVRWTGMVLAGLVAFQASPTRAAEWHPIDAFLNPDQQGRRAFEHGDFAGAASHFRDEMWRGAALYRAGKYAEAIDAFAQVRSPESDYNQGNALLQLGKFDEAVAAYKRALAQRKDWPEAEQNLAIAEQLVARKKKEDDEQQQEDPNQPPDQVKFDDKGKQGKKGEVDIAEQTSELWMKNINLSPTDLLARKFAIEAGGTGK
jgi:Ca-activated chloride channel family protein